MSEDDHDPQELRQRAEERLARMEASAQIEQAHDMQALIHELRTHQLELEMQNEELCRAELALTASRDRFADLYDFAPVGYVSVNDKGLILQANMTLAGMLGVDRKGLLKQPFSTFVVSDDQAIYYMHRKAVVAAGQRQSAVLRLHKAAGQPFWIRLESLPCQQPDASGESLRMVISDISEQKKAEERASELMHVIGQAGEGIMITDADGVIEYVNRAFTLSSGYSHNAVIGKKPSLLHSGRHDRHFYKQMWSKINNSGEWLGKVWNRRKNGEIYPERLQITAIRGSDGDIAHYCAVYADISEQISLEGQLLQSQKMEAVGTLVGGIAHDFNNMLAAITGGLYLVRLDAEGLPDIAGQIEDVEKQCFRAADLIAQLLIFARKGIVHIAPFNLTAFLKEALKLIRISVPANIDLADQICSEALYIRGDATQVQQILMNLVGNARDAIVYAEQPAITVSLSAFEAGQAFLLRHPEVDSRHFARLSVTDNGFGIPALNLKHLFEPYFTTKPVGKGSGLGLAMVFGAVQTHRGAIDVESRVNEGSTFHIYLPLCQDGATMPADEAIEPVERGRGETILLVDDEAAVRTVMSKLLHVQGYKVIEAGDGEQALALFREQQADIDLVILDIIMPNMGGLPAAREMRKLCPEMPIIFFTGYGVEHVLSEADRLPGTIALCKPVPVQELNRNIRAMLSSAPKGG
ncbi:MAG: hypothetical protein COW18_00265 [Zetaproteobacteria bacterium CG12_big_fil_rev_8_21_14_0_65_54_13]|nr:MAG: hypothetical protein COW18_00265 [Zetaproteobacteria bacterium CG12_big_fil_rev_8_21_14_0_65_54_13]